MKNTLLFKKLFPVAIKEEAVLIRYRFTIIIKCNIVIVICAMYKSDL